MIPHAIRLMHQPRRIWIFVLCAVLAFAADIGSKMWAFRTVAENPIELSCVDGRLEIDEMIPNGSGGREPKPWLQTVFEGGAVTMVPAMPPHQPKVVVPKVLNLHLVVNQGAVFGLGQGHRFLFLGASVLALIAIGWTLLRSGARDWALHIALALILAGAMGNMYDRIAFGGVRDMLHLFPGVSLPFGFKWPGQPTGECWPWIFNVADVALLSGVGLILVLGFRKPKADAATTPAVGASLPGA